jgi:hypothetical protein
VAGEGTPIGARVAAFGLGGHLLRWTFEPSSDVLRPDGHWVRALLRLPVGRTELTGRISARVTVRRTLLGRPVGKVAATREHVELRIALADAWPVAGPAPWLLPPPAPSPEPIAPPEPAAGPSGEDELAQSPWLRRLLFAVDVERYSRHRDTEMARVQRDLWRSMRGACAASGVDWRECGRQASGDGYLLVLPTGLDEPDTVVRLLRGLTTALHAANTDPSRPQDLRPTRMRASLHQGLVREGHAGFLGSAAVDVFRVLDCGPLRAALAGSAEADLAVAWSERLYQDLVAQPHTGLDPESFSQAAVEVPEKEFSALVRIELRRRPPTGGPPEPDVPNLH